MNVVYPVTVSTSATHARASSATYWDYAGTLQTVLTDVLRFNWDRETNDFEGVLIEPAATNNFINNNAPVTQTRTLSNATEYTLSFYGASCSVKISMSGSVDVTVSGTGATVLTGLEKLPVSINIWRCFMVLLGGMGHYDSVVKDAKARAELKQTEETAAKSAKSPRHTATSGRQRSATSSRQDHAPWSW